MTRATCWVNERLRPPTETQRAGCRGTTQLTAGPDRGTASLGEEMWKYRGHRDYADEDGEAKGFTFGWGSRNRPGSTALKILKLHSFWEAQVCSSPGAQGRSWKEQGLWGQTHLSSNLGLGHTSTVTLGSLVHLRVSLCIK